MVQVERIEYRGWQDCLRLSNDLIEVIVTTQVGPRVMRLAYKGEENLFFEDRNLSGKHGGVEWVNYGGHRLWHAPEHPVRTYVPDNQTVKWEEHPGFLRFIQPVEIATGIQKEIDISLQPCRATLTILHRLRNYSLWVVELAPWALSVMAPGGVAVLPLPPRGTHAENLNPCSRLALWAYTDLSDPRWKWGKEFIHLHQDASMPNPQKIGSQSPDGWAAYWNRGYLFVKTVPYQASAPYPDLGCNIEVFTNAHMLELETLGPLTSLEPGQAVEHIETWHLAQIDSLPEDELELRQLIQSIITPNQ